MSKPLTVIVVEDEALLLMVIADELRDSGFNVHEACNADEAMALMERHRDISVLFTDIDMPGTIDGLRLSETVQKRWPEMRIIITSGKIRYNSIELPAGAVFVPKPYAVSRVAATIERLAAAPPTR